MLHLALAKDETELKQFLISRGLVHFEPEYKGIDDFEKVLDSAADLLIADRRTAVSSGLHKPGQAEYLDLCHAVFKIADKPGESALEVLKAVAGFALRKNPQ